MERKVKTMQRKIDEIHLFQTSVMETRIQRGDHMESIRGWTTNIDGGIKMYEGSESEMNRIIKDLQKTESEQAKCEEEELRQKNLNRK